MLNFLWIPDYGAYGAAAATAVSYMLCFAVRIRDVTRLIKYIVIAEPKLTYLWLILIFLLVTALNFGAVMSTAKKVLNRRSGDS